MPGCAWALAEIISRWGIPAGVFNLVMGRGSVIGNALVDHPGIHAISFTGSRRRGPRIAAACATKRKKVQLEMGGKNPQVVLDDADLKQAVELSVQSAFYSTGQRCTASSRLIVTEGIYPKFIEAMKARMAKIKVGDALAQGTDIGPVSSESQLRAGPGLHRDRPGRGRHAGRGRRAAEARDRGLLHDAGAVQRIGGEHAHQQGRDLRAGGQRDPGEELRGSAGDGERHQFGLSAGIATTSLKYATHFKRHARRAW